jgi:hypothetical protein
MLLWNPELLSLQLWISSILEAKLDQIRALHEQIEADINSYFIEMNNREA